MTISAMSLKIKGWKKILSIVGWSLLAILIAVYVIRLATWESSYYAEKEGSERAILIEEMEQKEQLIETQPTEDVVREYKVPSDQPKYLTIPKLGVSRARVIAVGIFNQFATIFSKNLTYLLTNGFLESLTPVIAVYHIVRTQSLKVFLVRKCLLLYHTLNACQILK